MGRLDNFRMGLSPKVDEQPFFTVNHSSILFSKKAVELMKYAPYVHCFFDDEDGQFAVQICDKDSDAVPFYRELTDGRKSVRWTKKSYVDFFSRYIDKNLSPDKGFRVTGEYFDDEKVMIFNLKKAAATKG